MERDPKKKPKFGFSANVAMLKVTKLEVAQRELDTSCDLYFAIGDLVSIHLLVSAAHEILAAFDRRVLKTGMLFDHPEQFIKPEYLEEYRKLMKGPANGFKHGAKDLEETVQLPWQMTEMLMFSAVEKYVEIKGRPTPKMQVIRTWIAVHCNLLTPKGEELYAATFIRERFPAFAREEFRKAFYPSCVEALQGEPKPGVTEWFRRFIASDLGHLPAPPTP